MDVLLYNSAVCRLCGEENENGSLLYSSDDDQPCPFELINTYLPLKVADDGELPRTICPGCSIQLEATVEFFNLIIKGQNTIKELQQRERTYKKSLQSKLGIESKTVTENILYEINTTNGIYQVEHPISVQVAGLDKPKKKRGRPPKKPKTEEELAQEAAERQKEKEQQEAKKDVKQDVELTGKRRRKTPTRFKEVVQGKELERIFKEEGVIDAEEIEPDNKPEVVEVQPEAVKEPEVIGHLEASGELVVVLKGKGRGRPKGRMRTTSQQCPVCGISFRCAGRYMSHVARHGAGRYACGGCGLGGSRLRLQQHQRDLGHKGLHVITDATKNDKLKSLEQREEVNSDTPIPEDVTENVDVTTTETELDAAEDSVENSIENCTINIESAPSKVDEIEVKAEEHEEDPLKTEDQPVPEVKGKPKLKCNMCEKMFSNKQSKSLHMKAVHAGERPYSCAECGSSFAYPRSLAVHAVTHRRRRTDHGFACDLCGKVLNHPSSVVYHKEAAHAGHQYVCLKCGKGFKHKQLLRRHQLVHSQLRPFSCKTCSATFKTKANLMNHQLLHTGVKKYSCETCKQRFAHKTSLTLHMRLHSGIKPFSCSVCGKCFSQKGNLSEHARTHTGERPYTCEHCPRAFTTSSQRRLHSRTHGENRPPPRRPPPRAPRPVEQRRITPIKPVNKQVSLLVSPNILRKVQRDEMVKEVSHPPADERVIYVTYDVDDGDEYEVIDADQVASDSVPAPCIEEKVVSSSAVYSGQSLLVRNDVASEDEYYQEEDRPQMAVTDEQGNPLHFTMQDGTRLAITSVDGKSLQVVTQDGQTIPVEINGYNDNELIVSMETEEREPEPESHQIVIQKTSDAPQFFTIV